MTTNANVVTNVNTTTYLATGFLQFDHDWTAFPATHFMLSTFAQANEVGQTIKMQLTIGASPTDPISAGGDDLTITNTQGVFNSGWVAVSDSLSGVQTMVVAYKGSNTTVDLGWRWVDVAFKIV